MDLLSAQRPELSQYIYANFVHFCRLLGPQREQSSIYTALSASIHRYQRGDGVSTPTEKVYKAGTSTKVIVICDMSIRVWGGIERV